MKKLNNSQLVSLIGGDDPCTPDAVKAGLAFGISLLFPGIGTGIASIGFSAWYIACAYRNR